MMLESIIIVLAMYLCFATLIISVYRSANYRSVYLTFFYFTAFFYLVGKLIAVESTSAERSILAFRIYRTSLFYMLTFLLLFAMDYYKITLKNEKTKWLLFIVPIFTTIWINMPFFEPSYIITENIYYYIDIKPMLINDFLVTYNFIILLAISLMCIYHIFIKKKISLINIAFFTLSLIIIISSVYEYLYSINMSFSILVLGGIFLITILFSFSKNSKNLIEHYREVAFECIDEGFIVTDKNYFIEKYNNSAKALFPELNKNGNYIHLKKIDSFPFFDLFVEKDYEIKRGNDYYRISLTKITDENQNITGNLIFIYKITEAKKISNKLELLYITDYLTSLHNREFFDTKLEEIIPNLLKTDRKFTFVMFDLDDFEKINNDFGRDFCNEVLQEFAKIIHTNIRQTDIACRYSEKKFVVLFKELDNKEILKISERIRVQLYNKKFTVDEAKVNVTTSAGIAEFSSFNFKSIEKSLSIVDNLIDKAKLDGKNRISYELEV